MCQAYGQAAACIATQQANCMCCTMCKFWQRWQPVRAGKSFFKKRKVPIPVNLERKDWAAQIQKALDGTYLNKNGGSCLSIRSVLQWQKCWLHGPCTSSICWQQDCCRHKILCIHASEQMQVSRSNVSACHESCSVCRSVTCSR